MGIETALVAAAVAGAVGTGYSMYAGERQAKEQRKARSQADEANRRAEATAAQQAKQAEQDMNRARVNRPDAGALLDAAAQENQSGAGSTMLTGPGGVDPNQLNLGKNTLLGG